MNYITAWDIGIFIVNLCCFAGCWYIFGQQHKLIDELRAITDRWDDGGEDDDGEEPGT